MGLTDKQVADMKTAAIYAARVAKRAEAGDKRIDAGTALAIIAFMSLWVPSAGLELIAENERLKGRVLELEAEARDSAFERSER